MRPRTAPAAIEADSLLTSHQAGVLLQVNPSSINNWVRDGRIPAFRTPGGHRRIRAADLVAFLTQHSMPIPRDLQGACVKRILWVDDDPKQLRAVDRLFKSYHDRIDLLTVENGIEALMKVGFFKPHLIVLDVRMPNLDGFEVVERLRENPETREIQVMMASAQVNDADLKRANALGVKRIIDKPVDTQVVLGELGLIPLNAVA